MDIVAYFSQIALTVCFTTGAVLAALWRKLSAMENSQSVITEKVEQIEKRLNGDVGIPGECKVHATLIAEHDRRIEEVEKRREREAIDRS